MGLSLARLATEADHPREAGSAAGWSSLHLVDVTHTYPGDEPALCFHTGPINLTIHPREITFITGGNGSGKTTLAKLIVGLYLPDGGKVLIDEVALGPATQLQHRARFSAIFSDYYLFERLFGFDGPDLDERVRRHLAQLGLEQKVEVERGVLSTTRLSQGQRSRPTWKTATSTCSTNGPPTRTLYSARSSTASCCHSSRCAAKQSSW
jgi:putative ATP-binding cassette transporter